MKARRIGYKLLLVCLLTTCGSADAVRSEDEPPSGQDLIDAIAAYITHMHKRNKEQNIKEHKNEVKKISKVIIEEMSSVAESDQHSFSIPLTVDLNTGENWGTLH